MILYVKFKGDLANLLLSLRTDPQHPVVASILRLKFTTMPLMCLQITPHRSVVLDIALGWRMNGLRDEIKPSSY